ncbi:NB-ARC domain-containing protein [Sphingobacterium sp. SG20118]|uniref:NB-ARC domain-containing protein n=1 Tax=Sphingobacterium sp. SG20118 TaxID=3367156 RepID=UPI0037DFC5F3
MSKLKEHFINSFATEIGQINGTDFEYLCKPLFALITSQDVLHKGHNLDTKPVGYTADFISSDLKIFGQCGTDPSYFTDFDKPFHDIERSLENHKRCDKIILFANRRETGGQVSQLNILINARWQNLLVDTYDSERIANCILKHMHNTPLVEEILEYLPKTYEYYRILPQTNKLPSFKTKYFQRKEESEIVEKLNKQDCLQIYGISGIGKTEVSISVANILQEEFDSVLWLDGSSFGTEFHNLSSVHISKFKNTLNLDYFLQECKVLIIVDNLNVKVKDFVSLFTASNNNGSKCLITSLQRNLESISSYNLSFIETEIAEKILLSAKNRPSDSQIKTIVSEVSGYPLVLNLIISAIDVDDFSWNDIINELTNLKDFPDSKNKRLSERIIGKFKSVISNELQWLKQINNRKISRHFLSETIGKKSVLELEKRSLIRIEDSFFFDTHQLILDSIISEITIENNIFILVGLEKYLSKFNEIKNIDYFHFLLNHNSLVREIYAGISFTKNLKKTILYALIQATDSFNSAVWFLKELNQIEYEPKINYYDLLLLIEKSEIELYQLDKSSDVYRDKCQEIINELTEVLNDVKESNFKIVLNHHIGKFFSRLKDEKKAIEYFNKVIAEDINADYSRLQLARIYLNKKNIENAKDEIKKVFSREIDFQNQSLSILLSFYELLSRNELQNERTKFLDDRIESFIKVILNSIDSNFEQPYMVLEKLSSHLGYLQKESFNEICEALPFPSNIDENKRLRLAFARIKLSQYKMLKYSDQLSKDNMEVVLSVAEKYFNSIKFENDIERKQQLDLYIASEQYDKALEFAEKFEDKNEPFYLQNLSKILRGKNNLEEALISIEKALINDKVVANYYKAAFLNDKAEILFMKRDRSCIETLKDAINNQNTERTKLSWKAKKEKWLADFEKRENEK